MELCLDLDRRHCANKEEQAWYILLEEAKVFRSGHCIDLRNIAAPAAFCKLGTIFSVSAILL